MKSYRTLQRFIDDGTTHEAGSVAQFDNIRAGQLMQFGLIAEASEAAFELNSESDSQTETEAAFELNSEPDSQTETEADDQPKRKRSK